MKEVVSLEHRSEGSPVQTDVVDMQPLTEIAAVTERGGYRCLGFSYQSLLLAEPNRKPLGREA